MDSQFCPSPTVAETKALASLARIAPLEHERVLEVLGEILAFCRRPDIQGFLFTQEPIQVSHFLTPNVLDRAFTGTLLFTRVEPGKQLHNTITDHSTGSFVLYPAFVSQNLSFGFAVNNIVYSPANTWETETGFSYNSEHRYVRDNEKQVLLSLADAEEVGIMQFQYLHQISTTCQFRTIACFLRKDFKAITASNQYDVTDVLGAMFHMHTGFEYRLCPLCMAPDGACRCEIPNYEPRHPFDREMVLRNIQKHLGSFEGSANVAFLNNGKFSQSASVGSRVTLQGKFDRDLAEDLRGWVLRKHCAPNSPWQSSLFTNHDRNEYAGSSSSVQDSKMDKGAEGLLKTLGRSSEVAGSFLSPHESYGYLSELLGAMGCDGLEASDSTSGLTNRALLMPELREASEMSSADVVRRSSAERFTMQSPKWSPYSRQTAKSDSDLDEIQRLKEERRKEQNRMSARKSNQKKKAFNDALKLSLKETHERAASLRALELELRKDNLELRKRLESR